MLQLVIPICKEKENNDNERMAKIGVKICLGCGSSDTCYNQNGIFCKKCGETRQYEWEKR